MAKEEKLDKYINKNTHAVIETACVLLGDWVLQSDFVVEKPIKPVVNEHPHAAASLSTEEQKTGNADFDSMTKAQITQELDAFGIEYNARANKKELYDLMMQGK